MKLVRINDRQYVNPGNVEFVELVALYSDFQVRVVSGGEYLIYAEEKTEKKAAERLGELVAKLEGN